MTRPRRRRLLTLLAAVGALTVVVLGGAYWQNIAAWIEFYRLFEYAGVNEQGLPEYRHRQTGIVMVRVPGGTFTMGISEEAAESIVAEILRLSSADLLRNSPGHEFVREPPHNVTLSPFLIAKYEVTQAEWMMVMGEEHWSSKGDSFPVENVSWEDCKELAGKTELSLPTEAQWEYACRAGSNGPFAGTGKLDDMGWYLDNSGAPTVPTTHPVGQKHPNAFGLHDMHGNVWEWCEDIYDVKFYSRPEALDPDPVAASGSVFRVVRGGSWLDVAESCRSACRNRFHPSITSRHLGFRPAFCPLPPGL